MGIAIFVNRAYHQYAWSNNFPIWTTLKKITLPRRKTGEEEEFGDFVS